MIVRKFKYGITMLVIPVLVAIVAVTALGQAEPQETLLFYTWARPDSLDEYQPIFEQFERETGIKVEVQGFAGRTDEYKDAILVNYLAGTGPDVISVSTHWFEELLALGVFLDLDPFVSVDSTLDPYEIFPASLAAWQDLDGRQYAMPFDNDIAVLLYNEELFERLGVALPDEHWAWDTWLDAGTRLTRDVDGDGLNDLFGMMTSWWSSWFSVIWANGGSMFTPDLKSNMKSAEVQEALEWYAEWFAPRRNLQVSSAADVSHLGASSPSVAFANGHVGMMPAGVWAIDYTVQTPDGFRFDFGAAPLPMSPTGGRATVVEGQGQAISVHAKNKEAAYRFIQLMVTEGQKIGAMAGRFPVTRSDALSEYFLPNWRPDHKRVAIDATLYARPLPQGVMWPVTRSIIDQVFEFFHGDQPLATVLENVDAQLNQKLNELVD